ncbi:hypothetical protein OKA05_02605 [Luteolibacter arcticus]|uniref:Uncharacterized protein n=1 Tax=Luteolibacter arcticus TaxID=1581411 RepID=A0ABT3GDP6_9BACT|nr:hypothetical protein [Luteolibacter arcticus]MCW1921425.1 hypothetical protein [Luteolibacter arcticus]
MKVTLAAIFALVAPAVIAAEAPKALADFLIPNTMIKGEVVVVVPPKELDKYIAKVEEAARKNPDWFREHAKNGKPGVPLPFDERLGLTKEEYDDYIKFWGKREFKGIEAVPIRLSEGSDGRWSIIVGGRASALSTLKFDPKADLFKSPNGELKRIEDVAADANSTLGAWTGHEWKFEEKSTLGTLKENFAIGKTGDKKYGLLVYRLQEVSEQGSKIADDGMVVRFPLGEAGVVKPKPTPAAPPSKPAPKPVTPKKK